MKANELIEFKSRDTQNIHKVCRMKSNELMIGNFIYGSDGKTYRIHSGDDFYFANDYNPIQLTEEWLYSLGFVDYKCKDDVEAYISDIFIYVNNCQIRLLECGENTFLLNEDRKGLLYVHQLQNLYFALTGNELTITQ